MKQSRWLLCVAKNCDWSRKITPLSNLTRASLLVEWKLTAKTELKCENYKSYLYGTPKWTKKFVQIWWRKINCVLLHTRREIKFLKFYSKWLLWKPATTFWGSVLQYWHQHFLLFYKTRFDCQISISCRFLFCSVQWT